jgi:hypothetical protein
MDMAIALPSNYPQLFAEWTKLLDEQCLDEANVFYFEKIIPAIAGYLFTQTPHVHRHFPGIISVLGYTPETVVLTARLLNPLTMVVLCTPETVAGLKVVRQYAGLAHERLHHEIFLHDAEHVDDIFLALERALARLDRSKPIALELTGGKKTMGMQLSSAASTLRHSRKLDINVVYLDYDDYLPQYRKPRPESVRLLVLKNTVEPALGILGRADPDTASEQSVVSKPVFIGRGFSPDPKAVFVLMPFTEKWSDRIWRLIQSECARCSFTATRASDLAGAELMEDIWEGICRAGLIIADLTGRNANVFYELGIAHTLGKKFILLTQNLPELPADMHRYRCVIYEDNADGYEMLSDGLRRRLQQQSE